MAARSALHDATAQLKRHLLALDAQLVQGGPFLFGTQPCIADFSAAHSLWFIRQAAPVAAILDNYRALTPWLDRMLGIGHHTHTEMTSGDAIAVAAAARERAHTSVTPGHGFEGGESVTVNATDYG